MNYTRTAIGLLSRQYRSVLLKCALINLGIFAFMGTANATYNLNDAVADTAASRNYALSEDEMVSTTLGTMGGTGATLTVDGTSSKYGINADTAAPAAVGGIAVGAGNTLILQNLGSVTVSGDGTAVTDYTVNSSINGFVNSAGGFVKNNGTLTISDVVFSNNTANGSGTGGGAISNGGNITAISNTAFIGNQSTSNHSYGGALNNDGGTIGNISGKFVGNEVAADWVGMGGVIRNDDAEIKDITADFIGNSISSDDLYGGVIYNGITYATLPSKIGNISGKFVNNSATATSLLTGSVISNDSSEIKDISADFIGNTGKTTSTTQAAYGLIYNAYSEIGDITGDFKNNTLTATHRVYGGILNAGDINKIDGSTFENNKIEGANGAYGTAISNYGGTFTEGITNAKFLSNNAISSAAFARGGAIWNYGTFNTITNSQFEGNTATAGTYAYGGALYSEGTIDSGISDTVFKNNTVNGGTYAYGGAIYTKNELAVTNAEFTENKASATNNQAFGGAVYASGSVLTFTNTSFSDNAATSTNSSAAGGAIFTNKDLTVAAQNEGKSVFKGNYVQISGGDKNYQAIFVNSQTATLTLDATTNGVIEMDDNIDGWGGYNTNITGDATGTVNLYNDVIDSDVSVEKVNISTADGTLHDYSLLSLTVDANAKWKIDVDAKNKTADTIATNDNSNSTDANANVSSIGTLTVNEINYVDSSQSDIADGFKVQILKTQGTATAADLQLAVGEDLAEKFVISQKEETVNDEVTANTKWADEFKKTGTITTTSGQFGLATTDTLNDSIGVTISTESEQVSEKLGDTLMLVNTAQLEEKNFTADKASDVYKAEDDLGTTYGKVNVIGKADGNNKSTVDLNGHDGFAMSEGSEIALKDVKLTGSSDSTVDIASRAKISLDNAEISGVNLNVDGELDVAENEVSAKKATFGKAATLKLLVNDIKDDHGAFKADSFDIAEGATLDVTFGQNPLGGEKTGEVALLSLTDGSDIDNNNFADSFHNNMYNFVRKSDKSGIYGVFQTKTAEEISRENGGTKTNQEAAAAWVDGPSFGGGAAAEIADGLAGLAQNNGMAFNDELTALAPNDDGMVQAVSADITDRLLLTIDNHLIDEAKEEGLSSGDSKTRGYPDLSGVKTWIKAYYGEAKLQRRGDIHGFDTDSIGFIAGVDKKVTSSVKAGFGMQYDDTDIDAFHRDVDAKTLLGFIYGEYRPGKWFVNGAFGYGVTDYDEDKSVLDKKVHAHYKAELYSVQALTGYTFKYFTPEVGARYYQIKRHGYTDGALQSVSGKNMDLLRATAGVKAENTYGIYKPHAYFGMVYDLVSDRDNAMVNLTNGASYTVHGKRLPRFGVELGAGVDVALTDRIEIGAGYEAKFRKDYQDHSGILKFKYNF